MTTARLGSRDVGLVVGLVAGGVGVLASEPTLLLAGTIGLVYSAYRSLSSVPTPNLEIERTVDPTDPLPGENVAVQVTVTNHGERALPDVRIVDGVPESLGVGAGSPRFGTALEPGESRSFTYTVTARRGTHPFGETAVECRSLSGAQSYRNTVELETVLDCAVTVEDVSAGSETLPYPGRIETEMPGNGVTFHSVREFQSTDSMSRIDWKRFARTNELTTVEYAATRTTAFVVVVDTRIDFAPDVRSPTADQYCRYAGERIGSALLDQNHQVGGARFDEGTYLEPSSGRTQLLRLRTLLLRGEHPDWSDADGGLIDSFDGRRFFEGAGVGSNPVADGGVREDANGPERVTDRDTRRLDRRLPDSVQVIFCTSLLDQRSADTARQLAAYGRDVTVVSPDVTGSESPGTTVERITRADRVRSLRGSVRIVDCEPTQPLSKALATAQQRWSR